MVEYVKALFSMFGNDETEGQGLVEYALIIALIAVVTVGALQALQGGIAGAFNNIVANL
jgi:pilus assembly protein Flp/PilA